MTDTTVDAAPIAPPAERIATLDIVRGVAVTGILAMNIVAFAMPFQAYLNPAVYGMAGPADFASWAVSFVLVDGKFRGLFSFLFGASTLLVVERAEAAGQSAAAVHYSRMAWLLLFGLAHFYLVWFGDILAAYALTGLVLFFFKDLPPRTLMVWGVALVIVQSLIFGGLAFSAADLAARAATDAEAARQWAALETQFGPSPGDAEIAKAMALHLGPWSGLVHEKLAMRTWEPLTTTLFFGWETLAYMLFGMAALKSGFFRGAWPVGRYRGIALIGLAITVPVYAFFAWRVASTGFSAEATLLYAFAAPTPLRPVMVFAIAALIIVLTRKGGAVVERIAAAGRAAFTNYLGTSILMTTLFYGYGFGLYGSLTRIQLWIPVVAVWAVMLLWSKPWLDRFRYGPFEWLWRSLSRRRLEPMRR